MSASLPCLPAFFCFACQTAAGSSVSWTITEFVALAATTLLIMLRNGVTINAAIIEKIVVIAVTRLRRVTRCREKFLLAALMFIFIFVLRFEIFVDPKIAF